MTMAGMLVMVVVYEFYLLFILLPTLTGWMIFIPAQTLIVGVKLLI